MNGEDMAEDKYKWGMAIDLDLCTGCQACVVACHAENNIPAVGEVETTRRRSMHWIRIERYWHGDGNELRAEFMPLLCQHCEHAPCEPVCPMYATYHDPNNQLNIQVYNRCAGIRYCGVNCPYKVRHFNWFDPYFPEPLNEQLNPDVTVRRRGIMEKCMFCVQRIRRAREEARAQGVPFDTEEVKPACVQTCPTDALVFGNLLDPESEVSRLARSPRAFLLLEDLGTKPSVSYLKRGESYVRTG
jgi:molybdopterin-containing oxidoreductase family iron-sulfur binding subunit